MLKSTIKSIKKDEDMPVIKRYLSDENLERSKNELKRLMTIIDNSRGELDLSIRDDYFNIYYKGNSLAKISFIQPDKYQVAIHNKFFKDTSADNADFYEEKVEAKNYTTATLTTEKPLFRFLQKKHITEFCGKIKQVNYGEEIVFEQALITDNLERDDLIIIDRQVTDRKLNRKRMDLLALKQVEFNRYCFLVVEVKLGNNPELKEDVSPQLEGYMNHIEDYFSDYQACYEKQFNQKRELGLIKIPIYESIEIEKPVQGIIVVGGYSKIAHDSITDLKGKFPHLQIKQFDYKL